MPDIDDIFDDEEDMRMYGKSSPEPQRPRLLRDLYDSNTNRLLGELRSKLSNVQSVRLSASPDGAYRHTLNAYVRTLNAAIDAVEKQCRSEIERDGADQ